MAHQELCLVAVSGKWEAELAGSKERLLRSLLNVSSEVMPNFPAPESGCGVYLVLGFLLVFKKSFVAEDEFSLTPIKQGAGGMWGLDSASSEQRQLHLGFFPMTCTAVCSASCWITLESHKCEDLKIIFCLRALISPHTSLFCLSSDSHPALLCGLSLQHL